MLTLSAIMVATTLAAAAEPGATVSYQVASGPEPAIHIGMPYTFGTHEMTAKVVRGDIKVREGSSAFVAGGFSVPISAIEVSNQTLACHMREALGLDYKKSKFPGEHVCSDGRLPVSGNDAIAFPEIAFQVTGIRFMDDASKLASGARTRLEVRGTWTIHGMSREQTIALLAIPSGGPQRPASVLKLTGKASIHLANFGVQVKPALVIHAGEDASVDFNLLLQEKP